MSKRWLGYACGIVAALASTGCGEEDEGKKIGASTGTWEVFMNPYPDMTVANPITAIAGTAEVYDLGAKTQVVLKLSGLPASRQFGSHVHKATCAEMKAGGHYQHMEGGATDPAFANPMNEIWLDFMSDPLGNGSANRTVNWEVAKERAKAVVVHDQATMTAAGVAGMAGPKLACVNLKFE